MKESGKHQMRTLAKEFGLSDVGLAKLSYIGGIVNTYVVLMREMKEKARLFPLDPVPLMRLAEENGIQVSELFTSIGIIHATLVCHAPNNEAMARMLDGLVGWHTDALLATTHVTFGRAE